jgi:small subunit ribosomal protein S27e
MAGNFYSVVCPDCENEQIVFDKASSTVACAVCGHTLARPMGGKAEIDGEVTETVENRSTTEFGDSGETAEAQ